jgi:hypothetical protein
MATVSDKFQADPARVKAAIAKIEDLGDLIQGIGDRFVERLDNAGDVLGHDEFGRTAGLQLNNQKLQLHRVVMALSQVAKGFPEALRQQGRHVQKSQMAVVEAIDAYRPQTELPPGKSGVHGGK